VVSCVDPTQREEEWIVDEFYPDCREDNGSGELGVQSLDRGLAFTLECVISLCMAHFSDDTLRYEPSISGHCTETDYPLT
jgi:hypothetical protein